MTNKSSSKKTVEGSSTTMDNKDLDSCFIIVPIGANNSSTRRRTDGVINASIMPVLEKYNFTPLPAHRISDTGSITHSIIEHILEDKLVIADISDLNPNVMYELAVRHCVAKPVITIAEKGTLLPFDIADQRTIFYRNDAQGVIDLRDELDEIIGVIINKGLEKNDIDNPVYKVKQDIVIKDSLVVGEGKKDALSYLINRLDGVDNSIASMGNAIASIASQKNNSSIIDDIVKSEDVVKETSITFNRPSNRYTGMSQSEKKKLLESLGIYKQ